MKFYLSFILLILSSSLLAQGRVNGGLDLSVGFSNNLTIYRAVNNDENRINPLVGISGSIEIVEENGVSFGVDMGYIKLLNCTWDERNTEYTSSGRIMKGLLRLSYYFKSERVVPYLSLGVGPNFIELLRERNRYNDFLNEYEYSERTESMIVFGFNPRAGALIKLDSHWNLNFALDYTGLVLDKNKYYGDAVDSVKGITNYYNLAAGLRYIFK